MNKDSSIALVYDGECPVCSAYCKALALREIDREFLIINAREPHPIVSEIHRLGLDMNEGFVLKIDDDYFHGADAIHRLALMSTKARTFNRVNYQIFRSRTISRLLYPLLRAGRNALLFLLRKRKIAA